jgi:DNA-directed RNA polymerase subunit RPC12/RpoP
MNKEITELNASQRKSDDVARLSVWSCLKCGAQFSGEKLFGRIEPGERCNRCPHCDSVRIVIPSRVEGAAQ